MGEKVFHFACQARYWFRNGSPQEKSAILQALGSNLILRDKELLIELKKPLTWIGHLVARIPEVRGGFEPEKSAQDEFKLEQTYSKNPIVLPRWEDFQTIPLKFKNEIYYPIKTRYRFL